MPISSKAPSFSLSEFQVVSDIPLTPEQADHAVWHAERLQKLRDALNSFYMPPAAGGEWQIHLTSFVRSRDSGSDHSTGAGLDWNVRDRTGTRYDDQTRWGRDWLAMNDPDSFAVLIYEPSFSQEGGWAHVHHARRGFSKNQAQNQAPQFLDEIREGVYQVASLLPFPKPTSRQVQAVVMLALLGIAVYFSTVGSRG